MPGDDAECTALQAVGAGTRVHIDYKNHSAVSLVLSCRKCLEHEMSQKGAKLGHRSVQTAPRVG